MARPSKLTDLVEQRLRYATAKGATRKLACRYAGVSPDALSEWLKLGAAELEAGDEEGRHARLLRALRQAEGEAGVEWLEKIDAAALGGDWRAAAWKMERLYPDEYGRKVLDHRFPTRAEVEEAARAAAKRAGVDEEEVVRAALALAEGNGA